MQLLGTVGVSIFESLQIGSPKQASLCRPAVDHTCIATDLKASSGLDVASQRA